MKALILVLVCAAVAVHAQRLERSVFSSGAVRSGTSTVAVHGTLGQPVVGIARGSAHAAFHGFWYRGGTGVQGVERAEPFAVRITPQPAVVSATLEVGCSGPVEASLVTVQGRRVVELELVPSAGGGHAATVDCSHLASGLYLVQVRCQGQEMFLPMMVAK
ncbi:MAG: hypothetical protein KatS3mg040_0374 [Candidatus Kapaibacterium sp.]|nr:MAG: hypothetical protein KatS3mg040_0374 [Candidatus Kapabacteria bacterium]